MGSQRVGHNRATSLSPQQGWGWWKGAFDSHYGNYFNHSFEGLGIRPTVSESHRPPGWCPRAQGNVLHRFHREACSLPKSFQWQKRKTQACSGTEVQLRTSEKNTAYHSKRKLLHHPLPFLAFAWQHFSFSPSREEIKEKFHLLDPLRQSKGDTIFLPFKLLSFLSSNFSLTRSKKSKQYVFLEWYT